MSATIAATPAPAYCDSSDGRAQVVAARERARDRMEHLAEQVLSAFRDEQERADERLRNALDELARHTIDVLA